MNSRTLIGPFSQVLPMTNLPIKGALVDEQLTINEHAGVLIKDDFIIGIGDWEELKKKYFYEDVNLIELDEPMVCIPGLVDSHTHICFGGSRANDFAMRNAGKSYLEIAKEGGGIWSTVQHTRAASEEELIFNIVKRAEKLLGMGITTIEVKSGYGLSVEQELKMLRAIKKANKLTPANLIPTCLAAHTMPKDFAPSDDSSPEQQKYAYLHKMEEYLFPILKEEQLSNRIDAFVEEEAFTPEMMQFYFGAAKEQGFDITVHADQFSTGGSKVAVEFGAVSADHLEASTEEEIQLLAASDTVATALPGASIGLGCAFTPARKLLDAGASVAIASDWNPGSAPQGNLLAQASILATFEKLTNAEVLAGLTYRAAHALRVEKVGQIAPDYKANLAVFPTANYQDILYKQGEMQPSMVMSHGILVKG